MEYNVKTQILKVDQEHPDDAVIALAARKIVEGGLVVFPTETVYGLGANAYDEDAIRLIFAVKHRPASDPLIVHLSSMSQLGDVAEELPPHARNLVERFWPGPLTLILRRKPVIPGAVSAGLPTVAVRMPRHPVALAFLRKAGVPVAAPSANLFMHPSPTTAGHVLDDLDGHVDLILDAGPSPIGMESSVVDLLHDPPILLRPGGTSLEELRAIVPTITSEPGYFDLQTAVAGASSPGMLLRHYSPRAALLMFAGTPDKVLARMRSSATTLLAAGRSVGILSSGEFAQQFQDLDVVVNSLGSMQDLRNVGRNLFASMRELDKAGVDVILVGEFSTKGIGLAIRDRLIRASAGRVVETSNDCLQTCTIDSQSFLL
jgi:L-threonylcarbamoyladenylate synthase